MQWLATFDNKACNAVVLQLHIGCCWQAAFANSDADLQMLQWTAAGSAPRLYLLVHQTDATREIVYDRDSAVGRLTEALIEAEKSGWTVVDMQADWALIYP